MRTIVTYTRHNIGSDPDEEQTEHRQGIVVKLGGGQFEPTIIDVATSEPVARWSANSGRWRILKKDGAGGRRGYDEVFIQHQGIESKLAELDLDDREAEVDDWTVHQISGYQRALLDVRHKLGLPIPKGQD